MRDESFQISERLKKTLDRLIGDGEEEAKIVSKRRDGPGVIKR